MATQTFAKLLLCGVVILTGLVAIPVAVAAIGEEEASLHRQGDRRQYGQAIDLTAAGSHIGISIVDVERELPKVTARVELIEQAAGRVADLEHGDGALRRVQVTVGRQPIVDLADPPGVGYLELGERLLAFIHEPHHRDDAASR